MRISFILFLISTLVFSSCEEEVETNDFSEDLNIYQPYDDNYIFSDNEFSIIWSNLESETGILPNSGIYIELSPFYLLNVWEANSDSLVYSIETENDYANLTFQYNTEYYCQVTAYYTEDIFFESEIKYFSIDLKTCNGDVDLRSQTAVEEFALNGYQRITGSLDIGGVLHNDNDPITDISGLSSIIRIDESLTISGNNELETVNSFVNIKHVNFVYIYHNDNLKSIEGFQLLDSISKLSIYSNSALSSFNAFENLIITRGDFDLRHNSSQSINEFDKLEKVGGDLKIWECAFQHINVFPNLDSIGGNLTIDYNPNLTSVEGFSNLKYIGQSFHISDNPALNHIEGFESLDYVGFYFDIRNNDILQYFDGFDILAYVVYAVSIQDNTDLMGFCGLQNLVVNGEVPEHYYVSGNAFNPTVQEIIDLDCSK